MDKKISSYMKNISIFSQLNQSEMVVLSEKCTICHLKRGEHAFSAGYQATHVYIILSGSAKLVRSHPDGKERIVHLLMRGEMFGAALVMQGGFYPVNAIALEQSTVMKIEAKTFQDFFLLHPKVGQILIAQLGERIRQAHSDRVMSFDSTEKRIAIFLLDLLERIQNTYGSTSRITIPLTRQDIADRVGSTVETVIRILSTWSKQKLIDTQDKYIEIPNMSTLRQVVGLTLNP